MSKDISKKESNKNGIEMANQTPNDGPSLTKGQRFMPQIDVVNPRGTKTNASRVSLVTSLACLIALLDSAIIAWFISSVICA